MTSDHLAKQREAFDRRFAEGSRPHVTSADPLVTYLVRWRLRAAMARLGKVIGAPLPPDASILVLCAGEGLEGSVLCDTGYRNVTVSDISAEGVRRATERDPRLRGKVLNAEDATIEDNAYDVVLVQDGLHHLQNPVRGFSEMLRIAKRAAVFLEPHQSLAGSLLGTTWEVHGDSVNYVFRWDRRLVEDVASSYLGRNRFVNASFSFWHHNIACERLGRYLGPSAASVRSIAAIKAIMDTALGRFGNQFCGLVVKR